MTDPARQASEDELARIDSRIALLRDEAIRAHASWVAADGALRAAVGERQRLAVRLAASQSAAHAATAPPAPVPSQAGPPPASATATTSATPEASTRTVQNVLFILGGLLVGTAAIVFTVVAWTTFGLVGRRRSWAW